LLLFTLLLHKDAIELAEYHHKKSVFQHLIIASKDNQLGDSAVDIDLSGILQLFRSDESENRI
jgi:hypothetical protein